MPRRSHVTVTRRNLSRIQPRPQGAFLWLWRWGANSKARESALGTRLSKHYKSVNIETDHWINCNVFFGPGMLVVSNIYLIWIFLVRFIYSIHIIQFFSFVCILTWPLLGIKKAWATPRSVFFRGLIQNFRQASPPLSYAESPPPRGFSTQPLK